MPFPVDNIRAICAQKGTSLKQIEKELGIGNGVIARWENKKGSPPYDRIIAIAEHLNVPVSELTGEVEEKEKSPAPSGAELGVDDIRKLLGQMTTAEIASLMADAAEILKQRG